MSTFFVFSIPGLVVLLVVAGIVELLVTRRRNRRGDGKQKAVVASAGFDVLGQTFAPSMRHKQEHDEFLEVKREEDGDAAPPRSHVDLETGVARIVVPPRR